jgi:hypothetical protein
MAPQDETAADGGSDGAVGWADGLSFRKEDGDYITVMLLAAGLARMRDDRRRMDEGEYLEVYAKALKNMSPVIAWSVSSNLWMGAR